MLLKLLESIQPQIGEKMFLKYISVSSYIDEKLSIKFKTKITKKGWVWIGIMFVSLIWISFITGLILRFLVM